MLHWLKHAFAVDPPGPAVPTDAQRAAIDRVCRIVVARGLTMPALLFLESVRPLNYISAQTLHFFAPFITALQDTQACDDFARFLERGGAVEYLCQRLEELEHAARRAP
jgi:hypothetical protein